MRDLLLLVGVCYQLAAYMCHDGKLLCYVTTSHLTNGGERIRRFNLVAELAITPYLVLQQ